MVRSVIMGALAALQFLTRVPIRLRHEPSLTRTVAWFPFAGAVIGAVLGGAAVGLWHLTPPLVTGAVTITLGLLLTGAFHEDGLGDVADAFGGGWTIERRLEILKDSRHGTYGVAAMCASIVVRVVAVGALPGPGVLFASLVAAHTLGRAAAVGLAGSMPLATHSGLGADYGRGTTPLRATIGVLGGCSLAALTLAGLASLWWIGPLLAAALLAAIATGLLAKRKIGGISGDVLGAAEQVAECLVLVVCSSLAT